MVNHYASTADSPAWIAEINGTWTRNITGFTGLAATQSSDGTVTFQLANLHGDVVATASNSATATGITSYFEQTEYGVPRADNITKPSRYGWLGNAQRSTDSLADITLMGVRLYNSITGRFLQVDPIPGASANAYDYCNADPINCYDLDGRAPWWVALAAATAAGVASWVACSAVPFLRALGPTCDVIAGGVGGAVYEWVANGWNWKKVIAFAVGAVGGFVPGMRTLLPKALKSIVSFLSRNRARFAKVISFLTYLAAQWALTESYIRAQQRKRR
ncbi:hypothetical protein GCM10022226_00950 [Sphaerisporangium flaviroseum]|uniref:RHS repeat-associated core domain-containing protein n=2 Tax=Sphaerisporangium flaviroseum TaxID=509199 RepID=A0ABP7H706_9ACTN